jgi:hypothetical protein
MDYRLDVVLHNYNFKTRENEAGSIKVHIQTGLDSHTWTLEPQVNKDLSSMALSRENQVCTQRQIHTDTQ